MTDESGSPKQRNPLENDKAVKTPNSSTHEQGHEFDLKYDNDEIWAARKVS
jgi:hypothetical protein